MRIMLLDDERLALTGLEWLLRAYDELTVVGMYQNARQALEEIIEVKPDAVFLDIHMPEISGIDAAVQIKDRMPEVEIVFVTAFDEYAVQAFELNALDYLLKPLSRTRLDKTIKRLLDSRNSRRTVEPVMEPRQSTGAIGITCFQSLRFTFANKPSELPPWRTTKAQELFAYLLHNQGELVRKSTLLELLWPEELDMKRAMTQLYTTVYLVRQCLSKMELNVQIKNLSIQEGYVLDASKIQLETVLWEQQLTSLTGPIEQIHGELSKLLDRYEGGYLEEYDYLWAEHERERLSKLWLDRARVLAHYYAAADGAILKSVALHEKISSRDIYNENDALLLLELYERVGCSEKAGEYYERLEQLFKDDLSISLPNSLVQWHKRWELKRNH